MAGGSAQRGSAVAPPMVGDITIYIAQDPVDCRLGIKGLSVVVEATWRLDPFSRNPFCFTNKGKNQSKVLDWQRAGFCLWQKRLEEERFKWPTRLLRSRARRHLSPVVTLTEEPFLWLLDGLELKHLKAHRVRE